MMNSLHAAKLLSGTLLSAIFCSVLYYSDKSGLYASALPEELNTIIISYSTKCVLNKERDNIPLRAINNAAGSSSRGSRGSKRSPLEFEPTSHTDSDIATTRSYTISGKFEENTGNGDSCSFEDTWLKYTGVQLLTMHGDCERVGKDDIMNKLGSEECVLSYELDSVRHPSDVEMNNWAIAASRHSVAEMFTPNDYYLSKSWYYDRENAFHINSQEAWEISRGGSGLRSEQPDNTVAVIDFGFMSQHPDLSTQWYENPEEECYILGENGIDDDDNGLVDDCSGWNMAKNSNDLTGYSHGTKVAGVLAGATDNLIGVSSICHKCRILPVTISGSVSSEITGVNYAISKGVKIINLSVGGARSQSEYNMFAANPSVLFVLSSGNEACNLDTIETEGCKDSYGYDAGYPAALSDILNNVISVGSYGADGFMSSFSNYGVKRVQVMAPGSGVYTTDHSGSTPNYSARNGTSYAAPMVASVAGMIHQRFPNLTACQLREILALSCKVTPALIEKSSCDGIMNAGLAVRLAAEISHYPSILRCADLRNPNDSNMSADKTTHGVTKTIADNPNSKQPAAKRPTTAQRIEDEDARSNVVENSTKANYENNDARETQDNATKNKGRSETITMFDTTSYTGNSLGTTKQYSKTKADLMKTAVAGAGKITIMAKLIQLIYPLVALMIKAPVTMIVPKKLIAIVPTILLPNTNLLSMVLNPVGIEELTATDYGFLKDTLLLNFAANLLGGNSEENSQSLFSGGSFIESVYKTLALI